MRRARVGPGLAGGEVATTVAVTLFACVRASRAAGARPAKRSARQLSAPRLDLDTRPRVPPASATPSASPRRPRVSSVSAPAGTTCWDAHLGLWLWLGRQRLSRRLGCDPLHRSLLPRSTARAVRGRRDGTPQTAQASEIVKVQGARTRTRGRRSARMSSGCRARASGAGWFDSMPSILQSHTSPSVSCAAGVSQSVTRSR